MMQTLQINVKGKVQGVTYRETTRRKAVTLGLTGTVENLNNGDVLIIATGEQDILEGFVRWCHKGPQLASVSDVSFTEIPIRQFTGFSIKK
ncbi:MAG: acylphosphatase [Chitinophagaceae bacterium]|nr:MAG: acylphosphatase [Chitinophagaceae bacterium]